MANIGIDALKDKIDEKIVTNGAQEITAAVLNDVLQDSVDTLADGGNLDDGSVTKSKLQQNVSSDLDWAVASNSYYRNSQAGDVAAKVITTYKNMSLIGGGSLKVTFEQANTADDATLNIDGKGAKPLYYNGKRVSSTNSWEANETVEIYYNNYNSGIYYAKRWMVEPVSVSQNTSIDNADATAITIGNTDYNIRDEVAYDLMYQRDTAILLDTHRWRFSRKVIQGHTYYIKHLSGDLARIYTSTDDTTYLTTDKWVKFTAATSEFLYMYLATPVDAPTMDIVSEDGVIDELMRIEADFPIIKPTISINNRIGTYSCNVLAGHTYHVRRIGGTICSLYRESADQIRYLQLGVWYDWTPTTSGSPYSYFDSAEGIVNPQIEIVADDGLWEMVKQIDSSADSFALINLLDYFDTSVDIDTLRIIKPELYAIKSLQPIPESESLYLKYCSAFSTGYANDFLIRIVDANGVTVSQRNGGISQVGGKITLVTSGTYRFEFIIDLDNVIVPQSGYTDFTTKLPLNIHSFNGNYYKKSISDKSLVCFGDSITEFSQDNMRYSDYVGEILNIKTINLGVGGSKLRSSVDVTTSQDIYNKSLAMFDVVNLVTCVYNNDYSDLEDAAEYLDNLVGNTKRQDFVTKLEAVDWSNVGMITVFAGTNDWAALLGRGNIGNVDSTNPNYTLGAVNEIIRMIGDKFPNVKLYWISPIVRYDILAFNSSTSYSVGDVTIYGGQYWQFVNAHQGEWNASDVENLTTAQARQDRYFGDYLSYADYTLRQLSDKIGEVAELQHIPFCDLYNTLGWNKYNFRAYFNDMDNAHPYKGFKVLGERIAAFIRSKQ